MSEYVPVTSARPLNGALLAQKARRLVRQLRERGVGERTVRVAMLGGSTTQEVALFLELMLLERDLNPAMWQSEFGRFWEDGAMGNAELAAFAADIVWVYTSSRNVIHWPAVGASDDEVEAAAEMEIARLRQVWDGLQERGQALIVQNNFELPDVRMFGNLDAVLPSGRVAFTNRLNELIAAEVRQRPYLVLNDVHYLSARVGLDQWSEPGRWFRYKLTTTPQGSAEMAFNMAALVSARYGLSRKLLVLDLDNTVWGGVIGDDGAEAIVIGRETPQAEAYADFQQHARRLRERGIVLAVSSKNDDAVARSGFVHPDSVLKVDDFSAFKANWEPKHQNIEAIAHELSLGLDSFVFADDNPAERALVQAQLPMVAVPDIGAEASEFVRALDRQQYFEALSLSAEDLARTEQYAGNAKRNELQAKFASYDEFLASLEMRAEAGPFVPVYLERIAQLTGKTNQFNLTTRRYSQAEIAAMASDARTVTRYIRLADKFGDNGLVSVAQGVIDGDALRIDLWLMSCRVLKRDVELLMLDELAEAALALGLKRLRGVYIRTAKNGMVAGHYERLGFAQICGDESMSQWNLDLDGYVRQSKYIDRHQVAS